MSLRPELRLDWCDRRAAEYACKRWHYSGCLPVGKSAKLGVWEGTRFIGCVVFARGANHRIGSPYGLPQDQVCELVRVALTAHRHPVSRVVAVALRLLRQEFPGVRLVVSYADPQQSHHGGIYQAGNWLYAGPSESRMVFLVNGTPMHRRSVTAKYGTLRLDALKGMGLTVTRGEHVRKHTYLMPLSDDIRRQIVPLSKPYPKRVKQATAADQADGGGAAPTHTLQGTQLCPEASRQTIRTP